MKLLLIPLAAMFISVSHSQVVDPNCIHNVNTDFERPTNDDLPVSTAFPSGDTKYLNGFDFLPESGGMLTNYTCANMFFWGTQIYNMDNIMTSNLTYYNYIDDGPKLLNENGWELMLVNLGYYPDNVTEITGGNTFDPMPYIVIYNR